HPTNWPSFFRTSSCTTVHPCDSAGPRWSPEMDHGNWIADSITTYAVPVSGHVKRLPARNPSEAAPRGLASTWAWTAAKALCVMKIGYGEALGAPSTV